MTTILQTAQRLRPALERAAARVPDGLITAERAKATAVGVGLATAVGVVDHNLERRTSLPGNWAAMLALAGAAAAVVKRPTLGPAPHQLVAGGLVAGGGIALLHSGEPEPPEREAFKRRKRPTPKYTGTPESFLKKPMYYIAGNGKHIAVPREVKQLALKYGRERDLNPHLIVAQVGQESSYNPYAESEAGAKGYMQVMPDTAKGAGRYGMTYAQTFTPEGSVRFGTRYLKDKLGMHGTLRKALAGYNAGSGNVWKYEKQGYELPPFNETLGYVAIIPQNFRRLARSTDTKDSVSYPYKDRT